MTSASIQPEALNHRSFKPNTSAMSGPEIMVGMQMPQVVAWNAIIWGIVLYLADRFGRMEKTMADMGLPQALLIGLAQAIAIIPGITTSIAFTYDDVKYRPTWVATQIAKGKPYFLRLCSINCSLLR